MADRGSAAREASLPLFLRSVGVQDAPPAEIERRRLPGEDPGDETHWGAGGRPSAPIGGRETGAPSSVSCADSFPQGKPDAAAGRGRKETCINAGSDQVSGI